MTERVFLWAPPSDRAFRGTRYLATIAGALQWNNTLKYSKTKG